MKIHHLNLVTMCPFGGSLINGPSAGSIFSQAEMCAHSLLIETGDGLVLVDTGFGLAELDGRIEIPFFFKQVIRPVMNPDQAAVNQVRALGFDPKDVRHIVPTHLDLDHAGGLPDFPNATVHIYQDELEAALQPQSLTERNRYHQHHWRHHPHWQKYQIQGEDWFGFSAVRDLAGLPPEILLVPLPGHTRGHCAVAVNTGQGWLVHCGDAYFFRDAVEVSPYCPPALKLFEDSIAEDRTLFQQNQERLRSLNNDHASEVRLFCAHDAEEFRQLSTGRN